MRLDKAVDIQYRQDHDIEIFGQVLTHAAIGLGLDQCLEQFSRGFRRLPFAGVSAGVDHDRRLRQSIDGQLVCGIANPVGPDIPARQRLTNNGAGDFIGVRDHQGLVLHMQTGIFTEPVHRGQRGDRQRRRVAQRDIQTAAVILGIGEPDIAATGRKRVDDLVELVEQTLGACIGRDQQAGRDTQSSQQGAIHRASHCAISCLSFADKRGSAASRPSSALAAGLAWSRSARTALRLCVPAPSSRITPPSR